VVCDASEDVGQVGLRVEAVHLGGFGDGVDAGCSLTALVREVFIVLRFLVLRIPVIAIGWSGRW